MKKPTTTPLLHPTYTAIITILSISTISTICLLYFNTAPPPSNTIELRLLSAQLAEAEHRHHSRLSIIDGRLARVHAALDVLVAAMVVETDMRLKRGEAALDEGNDDAVVVGEEDGGELDE